MESLCQRAEVESGTLKLEVETAVAIVRTAAKVVGEGGWQEFRMIRGLRNGLTSMVASSRQFRADR